MNILWIMIIVAGLMFLFSDPINNTLNRVMKDIFNAEATEQVETDANLVMSREA